MIKRFFLLFIVSLFFASVLIISQHNSSVAIPVDKVILKATGEIKFLDLTPNTRYKVKIANNSPGVNVGGNSKSYGCALHLIEWPSQGNVKSIYFVLNNKNKEINFTTIANPKVLSRIHFSIIDSYYGDNSGYLELNVNRF